MKAFLLIASILVAIYHTDAYGFPATEVYEAASPSVVVIKASKEEGAGMIGAASVISKDGFIITNAHVVIDKSTGEPYPNVIVYQKPDRLTGITKKDLARGFKADVLHYSMELDLALLMSKGLPAHINALEFADSGEIKVGEEVVAIGHPEQGGFWSLTYGRISGGIQDYQNVSGKDVYQTDTSVNRGNSGGPLLDRRGYIVAINSNIARLGKDGLPITGVNFSIKSSVVRKWLDEKGFKISYGKMPLDGSQPIATEKKEEGPADQDRILTPKRPYDYDTLLKAAEKDLEEMMDEMRGKARKKP